MNKPGITFFVPKKLHAIFPTIENGIVPLEDERRGILVLSCEHNGSYTVAAYATNHMADKQYKTAQLLEVFIFSNFQDKEWFAQHLAYMCPARILMYVNRKHRSRHPISCITSTNESEVKRAKKFLGLGQTKTKGGLVAVLRKPEGEESE